MKLATYNDGSRDGQLVVVSRDLGLAHHATHIATRLQQVLDDWNFLSPQLQDLSVTLNQGKARHAFPFDPRECMAPLPRAYQWAGAMGCTAHRAGGGLAGAADAADGPGPLPLHAASDGFLGPCQDAFFGSTAWGIDFEAGLAAVTGDVAMGASDAQGLDGVRLLLLANRWCLRQPPHPGVPGPGPAGPGQVLGCAALHSQPAAAFGPVAVTPDELGGAWQGGQMLLRLRSAVNGRQVGLTDAEPGMALHIGQLIAHLARSREVRAGSIVGAVMFSHQAAADTAGGEAESALGQGAPARPGLAVGDVVRLEVTGPDGASVFGAIVQRVAGPQSPAAGGEQGAGPNAGLAAGLPAGLADSPAGTPAAP